MPGTPPNVVEVAKDFYNIRGSFKIAGVLDIGTQASLVRRASGKFVLLDACGLPSATQRWIREMTRDFEDLEAVLHLHPFHTLHVRDAHALFPKAKLFGTRRHAEKFSDLPWEPVRTESPELPRAFADDFEFSVPRGVAFVPSDPSLHFSSVLAFHRASKTLHVDDTLLYMRPPLLYPLFGVDVTRLHPTLGKVLEKTDDAVDQFRAWTQELLALVKDAENLCAAHSAALLAKENRGASIAARVEAAVKKAEGVLRRAGR